jgi:TatD DNase family protein
MLIDTHCHLHDRDAFPDPAQEIAFARENGVEQIIVVGVNPEDWQAAIAFAETHPEVFAICGWHPNYTATYSRDSLGHLRECLAHPKVKALGEIGLDYHWAYSPKELQFQALRDQLDLALQLGCPVVFHSREATSDLLTELEARPSHPYLIHCFSGSHEDAQRLFALGGMMGIDGPLTYKKAEELREIVRAMPRERLVLETDSPYMAPVPHRGKPNRPGYVRLVAEELARIWEVDIASACSSTTANARRFFRL